MSRVGLLNDKSFIEVGERRYQRQTWCFIYNEHFFGTEQGKGIKESQLYRNSWAFLYDKERWDTVFDLCWFTWLCTLLKAVVWDSPPTELS